MNTRDIADKLYSYAELLDAERSRANALFQVTRDESACALTHRLEEEVKAVREMATYLWDKKESI